MNVGWMRLQKQLVNHRLLIIDELGFVPLSKTGAELLFELVSQRYERAAVLITSNLPFDEWTETFGSERLTGALLDRLTHHVHILEMNGESFRLNHSRARKMAPAGLITTPSSAPKPNPDPPRTTSPTRLQVAVFCSALWSGFSPPLDIYSVPGEGYYFREIGGLGWNDDQALALAEAAVEAAMAVFRKQLGIM